MPRPEDEFPEMPRRRDEDLDVSRPRQLSGMDGLFGNTNIVALILFGFCCGTVALVLGIVGLVTCTDPKAKQNAMVVTIISAIMHVVGFVARLSGKF